MYILHILAHCHLLHTKQLQSTASASEFLYSTIPFPVRRGTKFTRKKKTKKVFENTEDACPEIIAE